MMLLERETALAALQTYLRDVAAGTGRLVMLAGEAGVGKSVLIEQLQRDTDGVRWAFGACDGLSTPRPLAPLFDLAVQLGGRLLELSRGPGDRDQLFRVLLQQLTDVTDPHVVVVEDVHWADEATLDLLRFLGPRIRALPVLLILTYRDDSPLMVNAVGSALGELGTLRWSRRLTVPPLSRTAVAQLAIGTELDPADLFDLTGGNPFYVTELIQAGARVVTASARDAVLARAARLAPAAQALLEGASLIGGRVAPAALIAATSCSTADLDELVTSGLLVEDGPLLRFRHEIARLAVAEGISSHRRKSIHTRVLCGMLAAGETDDSRLAFHADGAGDAAATLHHADRAARRAARLGSHREAIAQFQRALRYREAATTGRHAELLDGLAEESMLADDCQIAVEAGQQALALWRTLGDRRRHGRTLRRHADALLGLCRGSEALAAAQEAVAVLKPLGATTELAAALSTLAAFALMANDMAAASAVAGEAEEMARRIGATGVIVDAVNTQGCAIAYTDRAWTELVRRALELALSHNHQVQAARAYCNLYGVLADQHRYAEAEQHYVAGVAYCEEHDLHSYLYCLRAARAMVQVSQGRWNEALDVGHSLLGDGTTAPVNQICLRTRVGIVHVRRQDTRGWKMLNEAAEIAVPTGQPQYIVPLLLARTEALWLDGRDSDARREAEAALETVARPDPWMAGALDTWLRRTGSPRRPEHPLSRPYELMRLGEFGEAGEQWLGVGCPYDAAMAQLEAGDETSLRKALQTFDHLGARGAASYTRRRMQAQRIRAIPAGPRVTTARNPFGLTPRQQDVLSLVVEHRTNNEIARELFISPKTVDHHVSAVLAKLDVDSRGKAAEKVVRARTGALVT